MPSYQVTAVGFHGGKLYDPKGKRRVLHVDAAFKTCPPWLKPIKGENAAQKKSREDAQQRADSAAAAGIADDTANIQGASFMGVETL